MYRKLVDALTNIDEVIDNVETVIREKDDNYDEYEKHSYFLVHLNEAKHKLISTINACEKVQKMEV